MMAESKKLRIARLNLVNAKAAVDALPTIQQRAEAAVERAQEQLDLVTAELERVRKREVPAAHKWVKDLEKEIADLEQQEPQEG